MRRVLASSTAAIAAVLLAAPASPVAAETAYRYWSYWLEQDGAWVFAQEGPATRLPDDGAVEGWRFAVSTQSGDASLTPAMPAGNAFDAACAATPATADTKRIAVIVDFGTSADARDGDTPPATVSACAAVAPDATSIQALSSAFDLRIEDGLICGINGYPSQGCAEVVETTDAMAAASTVEAGEPGEVPGLGSSPLTVAVVALVLAAIAFLVRRRRR